MSDYFPGQPIPGRLQDQLHAYIPAVALERVRQAYGNLQLPDPEAQELLSRLVAVEAMPSDRRTANMRDKSDGAKNTMFGEASDDQLGFTSMAQGRGPRATRGVPTTKTAYDALKVYLGDLLECITAPPVTRDPEKFRAYVIEALLTRRGELRDILSGDLIETKPLMDDYSLRVALQQDPGILTLLEITDPDPLNPVRPHNFMALDEAQD